MGCKAKSKDHAVRAKKLLEVFRKWNDDKTINTLTKGDYKYWKTFYEEVTKKDFDYGNMPSMGKIKVLDRRLNRMIKGIKKNPGKLAEYLYLPENILSKNPLTKKYFDSMIYTGNFYRGHLEMFTSDIDLMAKMVQNAAREEGGMQVFKMNRKSAQKEIKRMEAEYQELGQRDPNAAERYWNNNLRVLDQTAELQVIQGVYDLITQPEKLFLKKGEKGSLHDKYGTAAVNIARLWVGGKDAGQYTLRDGKKAGMRDKLYEILENGMDAYIEVIKDQAVRTGTMDQTRAKLETLSTQLKKQKNFYPTQALGIFPALGRIGEALYESKTSKALEQSLPDINKMLDAVVSDLSMNPHTYESQGNVKRRSKDVISVIDQYAKDVIRFNYEANSTMNVTKALQSLQGMKGEALDTQLDFLSRYVLNTHATAMGSKNKNSKLAHIAKVITSWQFFSKLGFSPGTVARNATQSLQNFVYFGHKAWGDSNAYVKSKGLGDQIKAAMEDHGVFFVNLEEIAQTGDMLSSIKMVNGEPVRKDPGYNDWFSSSVEKLAKMSGKPMQWVENKVNRATTFKIAYAQMHQELSNNNGLIRRRMEKGVAKGTDIESEIVKEIANRSSRYAANMVKELHYEYSPFAKPGILQNPAGSILGQFTTYGINFFEYNRKIARDAGDSALSGEWNSPEVQRAFRLAMLYAGTSFILEPLTNAKWSNLIQHDTKDRIEQLFDFLTGDEQTRKGTFFGKGPLIGNMGPFVNDMFTLGNVIGFTKLTDNEMVSYLQGYRQKARETNDRRMQDAVGLFNMQLAKIMFSSAPKLRDGTGFMTILNQDYLHLWNTPEIKARRESMLLFPQKHGPAILKPYFQPSSQKKAAKERVAAAMGSYSDAKRDRLRSQTRAANARALDALDNFVNSNEWGR